MKILILSLLLTEAGSCYHVAINKIVELTENRIAE